MLVSFLLTTTPCANALLFLWWMDKKGKEKLDVLASPTQCKRWSRGKHPGNLPEINYSYALHFCFCSFNLLMNTFFPDNVEMLLTISLPCQLTSHRQSLMFIWWESFQVFRYTLTITHVHCEHTWYILCAFLAYMVSCFTYFSAIRFLPSQYV
jgi:hypothetical protein